MQKSLQVNYYKIMKFKHLIIIALIALTSCHGAKKEPTKVIAHRGFWKDLGNIENTIESLSNANKLSCYATEFDVRMTLDNVPIVIHDNIVQGMYIQGTKLEAIKNVTLDNENKIPTLDEFLDAAKDMSQNLFLELKETVSFNQEIQAVKEIKTSIEERNLMDRTSLISLSLSTCKNFLKQIPSCKVFYLCSDSTPDKIITPQQAKEIGLFGIGYQDKILRERPELIKECHKLGLEVNVWTVNSEEDMQYFIDKGVDYITTDMPLVAMELTKK